MGRPFLLALFLMVGGLMILPAEAFWTPEELSDDAFAELDGTIQLRFKEAVTAEPIVGLSFEAPGVSLTTGPDGIVRFPRKVIDGIVDKDLPFQATLKGYIPLNDTLKIRLGTLETTRFVLTRDIPVNQARMVLEWEKRPSDLDAWLIGPNFTVSYRSMKNAEGNAKLDRDARSGYGPEVLTLLSVKTEGEYLFSVQNYSKEAPMKNVKISFYVDGHLDRVFWIAESKEAKVDLIRIRNGKAEYLVR